MDKRDKRYAEQTTVEKIFEAIFNVVDGSIRMMKRAASTEAAIRGKNYDEMVTNGKAEVLEILKNLDSRGSQVKDVEKNIRWLKEHEKRYRKAGGFADHYFDIVGVYDKKGAPTGEAKVYRIKRSRP
jgi:hypothetical protein